MKDPQAIGVFDSGIGGTSIWKEIVLRLTKESTIYLADSKNAPYGSKSKEQILALSIKNTEKLLSLGAKIIVVACNTATTNAIEYLRTHYEVPFIGIEPAIKPAALHSKTRAIGVLATRGTLNSALFNATSAAYADDLNTIEIIGEGLVPLIEKGDLEAPELRELLAKYVRPMLEANVDHIVLGCSHYPYLIPLLRSLVPKELTIIDSGLAAARQTEAVLAQNKQLNTSTAVSHQLFTNGNQDVLKGFLSRFRESVPAHIPVKIDHLDF